MTYRNHETAVRHEEFIQAFMTHGLDVEIHRHAAYQVVYAVEGRFETIVNDVSHDDVYGFLIAPHVPHRCTVHGQTLMILNIEPDSAPGEVVRRVLSGRPSVVHSGPEDAHKAFGVALPIAQDELCLHLARALLTSARRPFDDKRVSRAIDIARTKLTEKNASSEIALEVGLSPSRFRAIFKAQTGSSFSKFQIWTRLRHGGDLILSDTERSLTEIAVESGFYDLPQFDKYMAEMLGVPPSILREASDRIDVPSLLS